MIASVFMAQPAVAPANPCQVGLSLTGAVNQNVAQIGDTVTFTYTVTNLGTEPLTVVQGAAQLPSGLTLANASGGGADVHIEAQPPSEPNPTNASASGADLRVATAGQPSGLNLASPNEPGGAVDPATGFIVWVVDGGLAGGATTTLTLSSTAGEFGQWAPTVCVVGVDPAGDMVHDCEQVAVVIVEPTLTPTPTASATPTGTVPAPTQARTATPEATGTPAPTSRPRLNNAPAPTSTPVPTQTPRPSPTPPLTSTPGPTSTLVTPGPTSTPDLTNTPQPTTTPEATNTPLPTSTLAPTSGPTSTPTPCGNQGQACRTPSPTPMT